MSTCSLCTANITAEEPPILTVGAYGTPKYLCEACASAIDDMTTSHELDKIAAAFDRIGTAIEQNTASEGTVNRVITEIMEKSRTRAERIKAGTYDFAEDEVEDEIPDELPEELLETPEDKADEEARAALERKIDKFTNIGFAVGIIAALIFVLVKFVF